MNIDAYHGDILVSLQRLDGSHYAVQLFGVSAILWIQLCAVYGEIDVCRFAQLLNFLCHHLWTHIHCRRSSIFSQLIVFVANVVATPAKVFAYAHPVVAQPFVVAHRLQIFYLLRLAVFSPHHIRLVVFRLSPVALLHYVLSFAVYHHFGHHHLAIVGSYGWREHKLVVGTHLQFVQVHSHGKSHLFAHALNPHILYRYAFVGYMHTLAALPIAWSCGKGK